MHTITAALRANGQGLVITQAPPVLASGVIEFMRFNVELSEEWAGFDAPMLLLKNGAKVYPCAIINGQAVAEAEALANAGRVEVAILARNGNEQLTTQRVIIPLENSGL